MCKIKKMLAVVLALFMTFSMFAGIGLTANAEDEKPNFVFDVSKDNLKKGDTFDVKVSMKNMTDFASMKLEIKYDKLLLNCIDMQPLEDLFEPPKCSFGNGTATYEYPDMMVLPDDPLFNGDKDLFVMTFEVLEGGTYDIVITVESWKFNNKPENTTYSIEGPLPENYVGESGDFTFRITDGEVTITDCRHFAEGNVVIPSEIEGYPVTAIGENAFSSCSYITSVTIPDGVATIGSNAFGYSESLVSVNIPASVTSIADDAFAKCKVLETVKIDANNQCYTNDENGVVLNKDKAVLELYPAGKKDTSYAIPDSVTTIGAYAFYYARNLKNVYFTDNVTSIGKMAFFSSSVECLIIPESVTDIAGDAFACMGIRVAIFPEGTTQNPNFNGTGIRNIFIPASVKKIDKGSFSNVQSLTDIYYAGSEKDWNNIEFEEFLDYDTFENVTIHYSSCNEVVIQSKTNGNSINAVKKDSAFVTAVKGYKYTVVDAYGKELAADSLVGTGCIIKLYDADKELSQMKQIVVQYDVNGDGQITAADARLALRASAQLEKISGVYAIAANVNGDDDITASDARKILRKSAGLE